MQKPVTFQDHALPSGAPEAEAEDRVDLLRLVRTLWLGKLWIMLAVGLCILFAGYQTFVVATPLHEARVEMALQITNPPTPDLQSIVQGFSGDEASINTEMAVITSGELIGRLVDELDLVADPEFNALLPDPEARPDFVGQALGAVKQGILSGIRAVVPAGGAEGPEGEAPTAEDLARQERLDVVEAVRGSVSTESGFDTFVFAISATSRDPDKAVLLANTLARLYRDDQIRIKVEATERMATWLSNRVGELRAELDDGQNEISDLRARSSLVSPESLQALNEQAIALRGELSEVESGLARTEERLAALQAAASGDVEAKLEAAQDGQLQSAASALDPSQPTSSFRFDRRFNQILLQTEAERDRGIERQAELQRNVDDLSSQFEAQSADLLQLQQLEQEIEATQVLYETFLTRLKEATVQESAHQADSRLLTGASMALQVAPQPSRALLMAVLLGLMAGSAIVLGREFLQNAFRSAEDLEARTGRAVLGQIPRMPVRSRPEVLRYLLDKPTSAAAEAVRNLRTSLLLSDVDRPPRVIMTTSSVPAEGKTTITIALAQNLAGLDKRVLLIEGDIRRRTFDAYFQGATAKGGGLLSAVTGKQTLEQAAIRPEGLGFEVLMGERSSINAADLFSSQAFARLVEEARQTYDYVLIDTPPVLVVPDARVIAQHADAVAYVVQWDRTPKSQVEEGLRQLRSVNVSVTGLVLSRIDPKGMRRYGYGGRYGPYSRYGQSYYEA